MDDLIAQKVGEGILIAAEAEEQLLDAQLKKLEEMDEDDFEALREKRKLALKKKILQEQVWRQQGHGRYLEINDTKEFFNVAKKSERVIAHFYRSVTPRCEIVDSHLERIAVEHIETKFVKINVEKNPYLVEKLKIIIMPTIVLIKDGKTQHSIRGFDEFGGTDNFSTDVVKFVLASHGVLSYDQDKSDELARRNGGINSTRINFSNKDFNEGSDED